ncbi:uncharacterized protein LOC113312602 [Papaver somniferum]|uniref:uncharacterized protein LOC113312602 n=1 Tax=Papaver somniferum TaxID=3469 RepID=UPI000E7046CA|nr:uncharacterized protein LOC113312602 [Papaver somniferum]
MPPNAVNTVKCPGNNSKDNSLVGSSESRGRRTVLSCNDQFSPNATLDIMAKAEKELSKIARNSTECIDLQDHGKLIDEFGKSFDREQVLHGIVGSFFKEIEKLLQDNNLQHCKIDNLEKLMLERKEYNSWVGDSIKDLLLVQNDVRNELTNLQLQINQLIDGKARIVGAQNILTINQKNFILDCAKARHYARTIDRKVSVMNFEHGVSTVNMIKDISDSYFDGPLQRSLEEDFRPSTVKARAKENRDAPADNRRVTYDELRKRKVEDDELEDRLRRRDRIERRIAAAEEKLYSRVRVEGVSSDSDASEDESIWGSPEREIKPDRFTREIEKLSRANPEAEREEEAGWDAYEEDIHPDFVNDPDSDADEEREEDLAEDDDDESDDSEKSDDSDESD